MFRFSIIAAGFALSSLMAADGLAQGTGKTVWVGLHLHGTGAEDISEFVRYNIELRLVDIVGRGRASPALDAFLAGHDVRKANLSTSDADRENYFQNNPDTTLFVASGIGIGDVAEMESGVYLGPGDNMLVVDRARAKLLAVSSQPVADMYLRLLLHYALIKHALQQGMDYETVISPLREKALDLVHQAKPAQPATVDIIQGELIALSGLR